MSRSALLRKRQSWISMARAFKTRNAQRLREAGVPVEHHALSDERCTGASNRCDWACCFACTPDVNVAFALDTAQAAAKALANVNEERCCDDAKALAALHTILSFDFGAFVNSGTSRQTSSLLGKRKATTSKRFVPFDPTPVHAVAKAVQVLQQSPSAAAEQSQ